MVDPVKVSYGQPVFTTRTTTERGGMWLVEVRFDDEWAVYGPPYDHKCATVVARELGRYRREVRLRPAGDDELAAIAETASPA